jgi:hypothetical protein
LPKIKLNLLMYRVPLQLFSRQMKQAFSLETRLRIDNLVNALLNIKKRVKHVLKIRNISALNAFSDLYGPVTFQDTLKLHIGKFHLITHSVFKCLTRKRPREHWPLTKKITSGNILHASRTNVENVSFGLRVGQMYIFTCTNFTM